MGYTILHIVDWLLWSIMAASALYVFFFSLTSLLPKRKREPVLNGSKQSTFLVFFPAYHEDAVIATSVQTFLKQDYPSSNYQVVVISDHMTDETNERLSALPIKLLRPVFERSSKAKALQHAINFIESSDTKLRFDYIIILDADNIVKEDFLTRLNQECSNGYQAIQCHRTAKNSDNDIAVLDGLSEEINNSIFRKGHNRIGMSSALIGSGMCFDYSWFKKNVFTLDSAVEDREMEALLMKQGIYIHYAEEIHVFDEKVSNSNNFQRQRLRWMTGQIQAFCNMLPYFPKAVATGNINYIDKTIQQALIPRSVLLALTQLISILITIIAPVYSIKWWCLFVVICIALYLAIPIQLRNFSVFSKILSFPRLVWRMLLNAFRINRKNTDFIHTTHEK
ncbi:MAG: glycosyltransferase [Prevotella sp.]|nr:glycosyltransferase [Prevotella sp.]